MGADNSHWIFVIIIIINVVSDLYECPCAEVIGQLYGLGFLFIFLLGIDIRLSGLH